MTLLNSEVTRLTRQLDATRRELSRTVSDRGSVTREYESSCERCLNLPRQVKEHQATLELSLIHISEPTRLALI
eukprot:8024974-Alexandrium_andersonii.AAC.1